ncbi:MAG TPA: ATP-dependent DNA helicase RecG, partial [Clostridiales bacterium]|nr:ATP-dependent DNA helicase RecG [Clostridiales bacterium]
MNDTLVTLDSPVTCLKGIGPKKKERLSALGIHTLKDLLFHVPRGYRDRSIIIPLLESTGEIATYVLTVFTQPLLSRLPAGKKVVSFFAGDDSGRVRVFFFNQPYIRSSFVVGETYRFTGKVMRKGNTLSLANPEFDRKNDLFQTLIPIYPLTDGINNRALSTWCKEAFTLLPPSAWRDTLPEDILTRHRFMSLYEALYTLHFPESGKNREEAARRMAFEELYVFCLKMMALKKKRGGAKKIRFHPVDLTPFLSVLPFTLTSAQEKAIWEICQDFTAAPHAMNRLLQGDVGSGKTVVAAAAIYHTVKNGYAAAMMAPTEILALQHANTMEKLLSPHGIRIALLTGSTVKSKRKVLDEKMQNHEIDLLIGTHALIENTVWMNNLALVITDEQHRFGVKQRKALAMKAEEKNMLVMSATPIPRTLALFMYADLSISVLDELPAGRKPVKTFLLSESYRKRIQDFIRKQVMQRHQVYIVCPWVEDSEEAEEDWKAVESYYHTLKTQIFRDLRVDYLHGRLKSKEKEKKMTDFSRGDTDILLSTTVIEVGVDVPNATVMI